MTISASRSAVPAIEMKAVSKAFIKLPAVSAVDLSIPMGQLVGLIGPNGAGKTTILRMMTGLVRPDQGIVKVLGRSPGDPAVVASVGSLLEEPALYPYLTGYQTLRMVARYTATPFQEIDDVVELLDLGLHLGRKVSSYSLGTRQRMGIAIALLKRPQVLILDEPTNGLDPLVEKVFVRRLRELAAEGRTVVLASHLLNEVATLCERVVLLAGGRKVQDLDRKDLGLVPAFRLKLEDSFRAMFDVLNRTDVALACVVDGQLWIRCDDKDFDDVAVILSDTSFGADNIERFLPNLQELFMMAKTMTDQLMRNVK